MPTPNTNISGTSKERTSIIIYERNCFVSFFVYIAPFPATKPEVSKTLVHE